MSWKQKLGSRKFWYAGAAWLTGLLASFGVAENTIAQVALVISSIGALAVYIIAQASVDKEYEKKKGISEDETNL